MAVLDVALPDGSGVEVCRDIRVAHPQIGCLMLTSYADDDAMFQSVLAGAAGFVLKQVRGNDLVNAVRRVANGDSLLDPTMTRNLFERIRNPVATEDPPSEARHESTNRGRRVRREVTRNALTAAPREWRWN